MTLKIYVKITSKRTSKWTSQWVKTLPQMNFKTLAVALALYAKLEYRNYTTAFSFTVLTTIASLEEGG